MNFIELLLEQLPLRRASQESISSQKIYNSIFEIHQNEGKKIIIEGYISTRETRKAIFQVLRLKKNKVIILGHYKNKHLEKQMNESAFMGKKVMILGRVFFSEIPLEYDIFSRIGEPYLVDIESIVETKD